MVGATAAALRLAAELAGNIQRLGLRKPSSASWCLRDPMGAALIDGAAFSSTSETCIRILPQARDTRSRPSAVLEETC